MGIGFLNRKAQTSIEFLFLFLILVIVVNTIIYPRMREMQDSVTEIHRLGQARLAAKQVANAISEVAAATGESKQTIWIFLDSNIKLSCVDTPADKALIKFEVPMKLDYDFTVSEGDETIGGCGGIYGQFCQGAERIYLPNPNNVTLDCSNFKLCSEVYCKVIDGSIHKKAKITVIKHFLTSDAKPHIQVNADAAAPGG